MSSARLSFRPSAKLKIAVLSLLIVTAACSVSGVRAYRAGLDASGRRNAAFNESAQNKRAGRQVETELITIRPSGFEPSEVTRPAGEFILMVENRSGRGADLHLYSETGARLREVMSSDEEPDWNDVMDLHPGRYTLTDASLPELECHITVTAR
jgi:hypothetical protein